MLTAFLLNAVVVSPVCAQDTFTGKVVSVSDGDTLAVLRDRREVKIRRHGVDAPESTRAFGSLAKQFTSSEVLGQTITVRVVETDRYGLPGVEGSRSVAGCRRLEFESSSGKY